MRRQHFAWTYLVLAGVLTIYGGYSLIYNASKGKPLPVLGLVFLVIGSALFLIFIVLLIITYFKKKKTPTTPVQEVIKEEEPKPVKEEPVKVEKKEETKPAYTPKKKKYSDEVVYERRQSYSIYDSNTVYVKKVGYGPVLRVCGSQILDMRTNTYYTIDGRMVKLNGSGPVFEISGDKIRAAFGSYLYEISGSNINKVYGGYYASISGNYIQLYDLSEKYELSDSLSKNQILAVVALLFGRY